MLKKILLKFHGDNMMWTLRRELEAAGVEFDRDPVAREAP